jgi:RNA polymerase sigma factor (TIGR02999 family)
MDASHGKGPTHGGVTQLLQRWTAGDQGALDELLPIAYQELRRIAAGPARRGAPGHTLQTTGLVHEAHLRLVDQHDTRWQNRPQFFGVAAQAMRRVLIDYARGKKAAKRGGDAVRVTLKDPSAPAEGPDVELLALEEAMTRLAALEPQHATAVELRYFTGLCIEETAQVLGISPTTVKREWAMACAWLRRELAPDRGRPATTT